MYNEGSTAVVVSEPCFFLKFIRSASWFQNVIAAHFNFKGGGILGGLPGANSYSKAMVSYATNNKLNHLKVLLNSKLSRLVVWQRSFDRQKNLHTSKQIRWFLNLTQLEILTSTLQV